MPRLTITKAPGNSTHLLSGLYIFLSRYLACAALASHPRLASNMGIKRFKSIYPRHYTSSFPSLKIGQSRIEISMEKGNHTMGEFTTLRETKRKEEHSQSLQARAKVPPPPRLSEPRGHCIITISRYLLRPSLLISRQPLITRVSPTDQAGGPSRRGQQGVVRRGGHRHLHPQGTHHSFLPCKYLPPLTAARHRRSHHTRRPGQGCVVWLCVSPNKTDSL
ncbi:hypothetical protein E2C01_024569 [Portunus trituberculatus]|uniref:Uncharacterized protein n=1 Tax=Portunus trituberculatus TaxID=210409 RepID=A0A5B7EF47_PORTR|nr:hypothetical protein [Portunus trituberculatus]